MVVERIMSKEYSKRQVFNVICVDYVKKVCQNYVGWLDSVKILHTICY